MLAATQAAPGPGLAVFGLLFALAGFVMVKHHRRLGQENERRNVRWFGPRVGPHLDGSANQVRQAGFVFIAVGLGLTVFVLLT